MSFLLPRRQDAPIAPPLPPPPATATEANSSVQTAGERAGSGFTSLISTGGGGLKRKAKTQKASLIGGA
jgi:hypothetical protein